MSTATGLRAIRGGKKKTVHDTIRLLVLGAPSVGKSALIVRFLTSRFIGEYDHCGEMRYRHELVLDGDTISLEICDICPQSEYEFPSSESVLWADGFVLVYSITDRTSFNLIKRVRQFIVDTRLNSNNVNFSLSSNTSLNSTNANVATVPCVLVGNKADMVHLRQVATDEGEILSKDYDCGFAEVAAADQVSEVSDAFAEVVRDVLVNRRRIKLTSPAALLNRVLGSSRTRAYARGKSDSAL